MARATASRSRAAPEAAAGQSAAKKARSSKSSQEGASASKGARASTERAEEAAIPMGKYLVSTEKKVRDGAVRSLARYLSRSEAEPLSDLEMQKLWKGIFYCFWMSDKPRVQQALAQELADLLLSIKSVSSSAPGPSSAKAGNNGKSASLEHVEPAMRFLEGFYDAMIREWNGLDKWRMDKFYLLIRRFTNAALRLLARENWDRDATARFCGLLFKEGGPLCANDVKVPDGITYHMCDIYLDELNKAAAQSQGDDGAESRGATSQPLPILQLLQPFVDLAATCVSSLVYDRIVGSVLQPYLDDLLTTQIVEGALAEMSHEKAEKIGIDYLAVTQGAAKCSGGRSPMADQFSDELRRTIFAALFSAASASTSFEPRRRKLYRMCKDEEERREEEEEE